MTSALGSAVSSDLSSVYLGVEAGVREAEQEGGGEGHGLVGLDVADVVRLRVVVGVHGQVDEHEAVGEEAQQAAQDHHRVPALVIQLLELSTNLREVITEPGENPY